MTDVLQDMDRRGGIVVPQMWLLTGYRAGDNAQVLALAEALGWPFEVKHFSYRKYEFLTNRLLGPNLAGIDRMKSAVLTPPWPDLVITAGRRNEPIARWIKSHAGGHTRLVHLGRSWADARHFDLVVTTPQYFVPSAPNVLQIDLPLHRVEASRLAAAAERWRPVFAHLPRPLIAVLVGGDSPPYVFDAAMARRLGRAAAALARAVNGSLAVTTSPRTKAAAAAALQQAIDVPCHFHHWTADADRNPFFGYLALADGFIVTGESMSMVAEACATGKPVQILDMGHGWSRMRAPADEAVPMVRDHYPRLRPKRVLHWLLAHLLPDRVRRDIRPILRHVVTQSQATWLPEDGAPDRTAAARLLTQASDRITPPGASDLARTVTRVRALFG